MKITLRILKWLALSMLGLLFLVFLLLAFENGARSVTLSEAEKKPSNRKRRSTRRLNPAIMIPY
ncbi:MAG: hypothetical protein IPJ74_11620 [Saprospiraceae bacterium]|nr:hypothetical protein [Saprospiraceae bacterium]